MQLGWVGSRNHSVRGGAARGGQSHLGACAAGVGRPGRVVCRRSGPRPPPLRANSLRGGLAHRLVTSCEERDGGRSGVDSGHARGHRARCHRCLSRLRHDAAGAGRAAVGREHARHHQAAPGRYEPGGDAGTAAEAGRTLTDESRLYAALVVYTDFGGCRHMVAALGTTPARFRRVGLGARACMRESAAVVGAVHRGRRRRERAHAGRRRRAPRAAPRGRSCSVSSRSVSRCGLCLGSPEAVPAWAIPTLWVMHAEYCRIERWRGYFSSSFYVHLPDQTLESQSFRWRRPGSASRRAGRPEPPTTSWSAASNGPAGSATPTARTGSRPRSRVSSKRPKRCVSTRRRRHATGATADAGRGARPATADAPPDPPAAVHELRPREPQPELQRAEPPPAPAPVPGRGRRWLAPTAVGTFVVAAVAAGFLILEQRGNGKPAAAGGVTRTVAAHLSTGSSGAAPITKGVEGSAHSVVAKPAQADLRVAAHGNGSWLEIRRAPPPARSSTAPRLPTGRPCTSAGRSCGGGSARRRT